MDVWLEGCLPLKKRKASQVIFESDHQLVFKKLKTGDVFRGNFRFGFHPGSSSMNWKASSTKPGDGFVHNSKKMMGDDPSEIKNQKQIIITKNPSASSKTSMQVEGEKDIKETENQPSSIKKLKPSSPIEGNQSVDNLSTWSSCHAHQEEEDEEEDGHKKSMYCRPYKKFPSPANARRGWLETALRKGVDRPVLYSSKQVTNTDVDRVQHRLQLTGSQIESSLLPLRKLAEKAKKNPSPNGVAVKVMDRMGSVHNLTFKYVMTSRTYRFMGDDYSKFLEESALRAGQKMDVWGLPDLSGRDGVDYWLALVNSDIEYFTDIEGDDEDSRISEVMMLPAFPHWNIKV